MTNDEKNKDINWKEKDNQFWKEKLESLQYKVTRKGGTEKAFSGEHNERKDSGKYLCSCCEKELFSSKTKYDSGSGWPSFYQPADSESITYHDDHKLFRKRIEVKCAQCDAHLGHVFDDGPDPTGKRYCINSVSLKFKPE